ncbi:biopolymer transporter ExbD [Marinomonas spartinae]|nr:biopolymer transporter ExbD [Marinomonas spartinae]
MAEINVTPFIDVMLVLLIIFMVVAPLSTANIKLDLPSTTSKQQPNNVSHPITVSLKTNGDMYIGDDKQSKVGFVGALDKEVKGDKNTRIFIRADKEIDYGRLMAFMDLLRDGGYTKVALIGLPSTGAGSKK